MKREFPFQTVYKLSKRFTFTSCISEQTSFPTFQQRIPRISQVICRPFVKSNMWKVLDLWKICLRKVKIRSERVGRKTIFPHQLVPPTPQIKLHLTISGESTWIFRIFDADASTIFVSCLYADWENTIKFFNFISYYN